MTSAPKIPITAAELRAEIEARWPYAIAIKEAFLRNDIAGCEAAQKAMRDFCRGRA